MDALEKKVDRLKETVGEIERKKVLVPEKRMESLRENIESLNRNLDKAMEGHKPEESGGTGKGATPK